MLPRVRRASCAALLLLTGCVRAAAPETPSLSPACDKTQREVDALASAAVRDGPLAGATVVLEVRGRPIVERGYGFADLEQRAPADLDTVYGIASVSKMFTASIVMQLVDEKKVALDEPIDHFLPEIAGLEEPPTIAQLLSHTGGLREPPSPERPPSRPLTREDQIARLADARPEAPPGSAYRYSNFGYVMLGLVIERVERRAFADVLRERIAQRIDAPSVQPLDFARLIPRRARMYTALGGELRNAEPLSPSPLPSAGGLGASARDLLVFEHALEAGKIVSLESLARMRTPATLPDGSRTDYGLGTALVTAGGRRGFGHFGSNGYRAALLRFPAEDVTVVVLSNSDSERAKDLALRIAETALRDPSCGPN
jgi:CubicO group peptidase (beta-lactamase class C family)